MSILTRIRDWWRSAITGRFVSRKYAEQHPAETVHETAAEMIRRIKREYQEEDGA